MKKLTGILATTGAALAVAAPVYSFTTTPNRTYSDRLAAIVRAQRTAIEQQAALITQIQQALAARDACENVGLLYLPGHASADGNGCADPGNL